MGTTPGTDAVADAVVVRAADASAADAMDVAEGTTVAGEAVASGGELSSICRYARENTSKPDGVVGDAVRVAAAACGTLRRLDIGVVSCVEARGAVNGLWAAVAAGRGTWGLGKGVRGVRTAAAAAAVLTIGRGAGAGVAVGSGGTGGILNSSIVDHRAWGHQPVR